MDDTESSSKDGREGMTQALECQVCGEFIDTILSDKEVTTYHKECDVKRQQELVNCARGRQWRKLEGSKTTEYYEDDYTSAIP